MTFFGLDKSMEWTDKLASHVACPYCYLGCRNYCFHLSAKLYCSLNDNKYRLEERAKVRCCTFFTTAVPWIYNNKNWLFSLAFFIFLLSSINVSPCYTSKLVTLHQYYLRYSVFDIVHVYGGRLWNMNTMC